jgi:hypothetical protein
MARISGSWRPFRRSGAIPSEQRAFSKRRRQTGGLSHSLRFLAFVLCGAASVSSFLISEADPVVGKAAERMMLFVLAGTLFGAILGLRFTALVLVPAMACSLIIAAAGAVTGGGPLGPKIIELALFLTCLQIGYLGAAAVRFSLSLRATQGLGQSDWSGNGRFRQSFRSHGRRPST